MRTFVISDIHGNNELLKKALKTVCLKKADKLFVLGDLIDRGTDSKGVLDTIILLKETGFDLECLVGNHEKMFLDAKTNTNSLNQWLINGGDKTLSSFLTRSIEKIPSRYFDLVNTFKLFINWENFIFVHAALNMKIEDPFSDLTTILWERNPYKFLEAGWLGDRKLVHGHHPQSQEQILNAVEKNESIICIDNGTYLKKTGYGSLCLLQLETLKCQFIL